LNAIEIRQQLIDISAQQTSDAGFGDLDAAFDAGVLQIRHLDVAADDFNRTYLAELQSLFRDPACYPVFDERMSALVRTAVDARQLDIAGYNTRRAPSATVSSRFLSRLPTFPSATVDEVVGIRDVLHSPLTRFRRELLQVVAEMQSRPWDAEFEHDVEAAWVGRVAPSATRAKRREAVGQALWPGGGGDAGGPGCALCRDEHDYSRFRSRRCWHCRRADRCGNEHRREAAHHDTQDGTQSILLPVRRGTAPRIPPAT